MEAKAIEIRNLTIGYRGKKNNVEIAKNLSANLFRGELTCLLGANGVGKSTLLRTLSGLQQTLAGDIFLQEKALATYTHQALSQTVGVVLTEKVEVNDLSVFELVSMGRSPYTGFWGKLNRADRDIVADSIAQVRISGLAQRSIQTLSDGERQKAMIAKALAQQTPVIFLDEPTAFLDFPSRVEILQLLKHLCHTAHKTIFLSTHDLELSLQIADKIWLMDKEKGITAGTTESLAKNGSLETFFSCEGVVFDKETRLFKIQ